MIKGSPLKISRVEIFTAHLPIDRDSSRFDEKSSHLEELYIKLTGEDGAVGWGEARGNAAHISGETPAGMEYVFKELLAPLVIGKELRGRAAIISLVHRTVEGNSGAKAALDIALHDLAARAAACEAVLEMSKAESSCTVLCSVGGIHAVMSALKGPESCVGDYDSGTLPRIGNPKLKGLRGGGGAGI